MSLTNNDLTKISELMQSNLRDYQGRLVSYIDKRLSDLEEKIEAKISHLPSKQEFFDRTNEILGNQVSDKQDLPAAPATVSVAFRPRQCFQHTRQQRFA